MVSIDPETSSSVRALVGCVDGSPISRSNKTILSHYRSIDRSFVRSGKSRRRTNLKVLALEAQPEAYHYPDDGQGRRQLRSGDGR